MDAAYDCPEIKEHSLSLNHQPIIDKNPRRNKELRFEIEQENRALKTINWKLADD